MPLPDRRRKLIEAPRPPPVVTYKRVDSGFGADDADPRANGWREPRFDAAPMDDETAAFEPRMARPAHRRRDDEMFAAAADRGRRDAADERRPGGLRLSLIGGALAFTVGIVVLVYSFTAATVGVRSPAIGGEASGSFESLADSVPGDGATGVLRDVSAFDSGAASASAQPADSDLSTSGIVVTDRVAATPPPPRVRPDPAAVAGARASQPAPTEFASAAAPTATELAPGPAPLAVPVAATPRAGTDGLIADVERILAEGHPADMPAMDALPPADLADAPAMDALSHDNPFDPVQTGATALPRPGTAFPPPPAGGSTTVEIYGPPSPYPAYPAPAYPSAGGAFGTPSPLAGKPLYIPPAPGGPVPPGEIPANGPSSTSIF